jgi:hypothetical protein
MKPEKAIEKDAAFCAAVETLVAEVEKGDPKHRQTSAAYVLAKLGLRRDDIAPIAALLGRIERGEDGALKESLLDHYAEREPKRFQQIDGHLDWMPGDSVMPPDYDGDCLTGGFIWELMRGPNGVRILIPDSTSYEAAIRLLRKAIDWLERFPGLLEFPPDEGMPPLGIKHMIVR